MATQQLVADPPAYPCPLLTDLMDAVSRLYPQVFYRPLFACAASSKEFTVVNHLCTITILSKFLEDFWIRGAEMISVALMSDVGGGNANAKETAANPVWGKARMGQSVVLLALIGQIQSERHAKELPSVPPPKTPEGLMDQTSALAIKLREWLGRRKEAKAAHSRCMRAVAEGREPVENISDLTGRRSRKTERRTRTGHGRRNAWRLRGKVAMADRLEYES